MDRNNDLPDLTQKPNDETTARLHDEIAGYGSPSHKTLQASPRVSGEIIPDRYIVTLKDKPLLGQHNNRSGPDNISTLMNKHGLPGTDPNTYVYRHALAGFAAKLTPQQKSALQADPSVAAIEPDRRVFLDPLSIGKPHSQPASELPTGIDRIDAEKSVTANAGPAVDVDVAVIDTGINSKHSDLNVVDGVNFVPPEEPWPWPVGNSKPDTAAAPGDGEDDHGHGSHVAGTIAARKDGKGVVGVAPGARLWSVKVLDAYGGGTLSGVAAGVDYVAKNAAKIEVANMSLGGRLKSEALDTAISNAVDAGVSFIVAAGNSNADADSFSPANHPKVLAVSAVADSDGKGGAIGPKVDGENDDTLANFSNYGEKVKIAAPGVDIESCWTSSGKDTDTFNKISGTSMASPHVAGAAALVKAAHPDYKPAQVYQTIIDAAKEQSDTEFGFSGDRDKFPEPMLNAANL